MLLALEGYLPAHSPELNPIERLRAFLRSHYFSNRVYKDDEDLFHAGKEAWSKMTTNEFSTVCATEWILPVN